MSAKEEIVKLFRKNVKGKKPNVESKNKGHDGKKGHWLEEQFGIIHNASNEPDLFGYELKNETKQKTTFGDWSANEYIFNDSQYASVFTGKTKIQKRDKFMDIFGKPNIEKGGRCSWSGEPCPKINRYNTFGQKLEIRENNDIIALYSYSEDTRPNKAEIVPEILRQDNLVLAKWYGNQTPSGKTGKCLKEKVEDKFNDKGWFTCKTDTEGKYDRICFGKPLTFENWIELVNEGIVYFDSGMHQGNKRPYSEWRANNNYWDSLITETFN